MFNYVKLPRVGDDGAMYVSVDDIVLIAQNADEQGPVEGTTAVYFRHSSLALAVNLSPESVLALVEERQ